MIHLEKRKKNEEKRAGGKVAETVSVINIQNVGNDLCISPKSSLNCTFRSLRIWSAVSEFHRNSMTGIEIYSGVHTFRFIFTLYFQLPLLQWLQHELNDQRLKRNHNCSFSVPF